MSANVQSLFAALSVLVISACNGQQQQQTSSPDVPAASEKAASCPQGSPVLSGQLHGAVTIALNADANTSICSGMARPADSGLRLRFQTEVAEQREILTMILGVDQLTRGDTGSSIRTTVTIIDEARQRFFSTGDRDNCFSDIQRHSETTDPQRSLIEGLLWCTSAVPELNGSTSIRISELAFRGFVNWRDAT